MRKRFQWYVTWEIPISRGYVKCWYSGLYDPNITKTGLWNEDSNVENVVRVNPLIR